MIELKCGRRGIVRREGFVAGKEKAEMKKITLVSLASFGFLMLSSLVAVLLEGVIKGDAVLSLVIGILTLLVSAAFAMFAKDSIKLNLSCFFISAVAMGFLLRAWYINRGFSNTLPVMLMVSASEVLYLWIFFALSRIPFIRRKKLYLSILLFLYALISVILYTVAVVKTETSYVSTLGYYMIIEFAFIFAMCLEVNSRRELIRNLTLSTYTIFGIAVIIAIFILLAALGGDSCDCDCGCDGDCAPDDCFDGCDCGGDGTAKKKKREGSKDF